MEKKITNQELAELNVGCLEMLAVEDLETLFSWRVSSVVELIAPKVKAFDRTRQAQDLRYATVDVKDAAGNVTGQRAKAEEAEEYLEHIQTLLDVGVNIKVPTIRLSEILRMREEEGVEITPSTMHKVRLITVVDIDLDAESSNGTDPANKDEDAEQPKKGRAGRRARASAKSD